MTISNTTQDACYYCNGTECAHCNPDLDITPAGQVRTAARLIRASADKATPGPWTASPVWSPRSTATSAVYSAALPPGSEVIGSTRRYGGCWRPQDAEYIALMHPSVASGVVDMLEHVGDDMADYGAHERDAAIGPVVHDEYGNYRTDWTAALKLARTVLGSTPAVEAVTPR